MTLRRALDIFAAVFLLGSISTGLVSSRCDLPRAGRSETSVSADASHDRETDPCASGCIPDCYACSQSEVAGVIQFESEPHVAVALFRAFETRASDGVVSLPYHPPLQLL